MIIQCANKKSSVLKTKEMKIVIIDNYDSFTYNLAHLVKQLGAEVEVYRNDQFTLGQLEPFDKIILSPGPGIPSEAGLLLDVIKTYAGRKPMLGVCLGHQAIGEVFGAKLENLSEVYHGVAATIVGWSAARSSPPPLRSPLSATTGRSWVSATDTTTSTAYSSTPRACSPRWAARS